MKISIITVSYNSGSTIGHTIESVLSQTYSDIEYIIIDGKSTDNTVDIIKEYEPKFGGRLKWISQTDESLYDGMNKGIKMASGDIVGTLNSDDFYHRNDTIELIAKGFSEDANVQLVFGDIRFVSPKNIKKTVRYYSSENFSPKRFRFGFMPPHPTFFTYKYNFEKIGYYNIDYKIAADYELLIRFLYTNKLNYKYLDFDFLKMRTGGASTGSLKIKYVINKEIVRACRENGIYTNMPILLLKYFVKVWELILLKE